VFDPFFTTRRDQGSTGLGLHIVHNIVINRWVAGSVLETKPGAGTKIRIVVPREAPLEFAGGIMRVVRRVRALAGTCRRQRQLP